MTWITDANNNRCSVEYWGSEDAAKKALASLIRCSDCSDCFRCSDCSDCFHCSDCSDCFRCSGCFRCSDCSDCFRCSDCSDCFRCSGCSDCFRCSGCSDCFRCSGCSDCFHCSDCSDCSDCFRCFRCSGCSDCFRCSGCSGCFDLKNAAITVESVAVPVIPDIHKALYAAVSRPDALDMTMWHTCDTTHCRAGWVVTLAGEDGKKLQRRFGSVLAAMKIYDASDPSYQINPGRFFDSNEEALADMKKLAGL